MWAMLGKQLLKGGVKKVAKDKILNRKKKTKKMASGKEVSDGIMNKEKDVKGGSLAVRPTTPLVHSARDFAPVSTSVGESDIVIIKKQVIQVRDILKDTRTAKQAERVNQRKARQTDKRKEREEKIEKPPVKPKDVSKSLRFVLLKNTTNAAPDAVKPQVNNPANKACKTGCCWINQVYKSVIFV